LLRFLFLRLGAASADSVGQLLLELGQRLGALALPSAATCVRYAGDVVDLLLPVRMAAYSDWSRDVHDPEQRPPSDKQDTCGVQSRSE
jgi:hypothetical protein